MNALPQYISLINIKPAGNYFLPVIRNSTFYNVQIFQYH